MNSPTEGENNGGGGKEIDSNEEGSFSGTNKQQISIGEAEKANEPTKMSGSELVKTDSEDSRNPTFVVIDQPKTIKKVIVQTI